VASAESVSAATSGGIPEAIRADTSGLIGTVLVLGLIAAAHATNNVAVLWALNLATVAVFLALVESTPLQLFLLTVCVLDSQGLTLGRVRLNAPGDFVAVGLVGAFLLRQYLSRRREPLYSGNLTILLPIIALVCYGILSLLWAAAPGKQLQNIVIWTWLVVFFVGLSNVINERGAVWAVMWATVLVAVTEALEATALVGLQEIGATARRRLNLAFAQPLGGLVLLTWLLYAPGARGANKKLLRYAAHGLLGLIVVGLLVNHKKAGLAAFPIPAAIVMLRALRPTRFRPLALAWLVLPVVLAGAIYVAFPRVSRRQIHMLTVTAIGVHISARERLQVWRMSLDMWKDHPWLGLGFSTDNLEARYHRYYRYNDPYVLTPYFDPHNIVLFFLSTTGLVGFALFLAVVVGAYRVIARLGSDDPSTTWLKPALYGLWTCFLIIQLFDPFHLQRRPYFVILLATIGQSVKLFASRRRAGERPGG